VRAVALLIAVAACGRFGFDARDRDGGTGDGPGVAGKCTVTDVAIGRTHTCMIESGSAWCWGRNPSGQAMPSSDPAGYVLSPSRVTLPSTVVQIAAGRGFSCARLDTGDVYCWGENTGGTLGDGTMSPTVTPVKVALGSETAIDVAAGTYHACIRRASDHAVMCWGSNMFGETGQPTGTETLVPSVVANTAGARELGIGHKHNCIVDATGQARCWGRNEWGQLADPTLVDRGDANVGIGLTGNLRAVAAGGRHSCGVDMNGLVRCWGKSTEGQRGTAPDGATHPEESAAITSNAVDVQATTAGVCARRMDGSVVCWGDHSPGDGTYTFDETPKPSSLVGVEKIAVGYYHACAIETPGQLKCWGNNTSAELGRGRRDITPSPQPVALAASALSLGGSTVCARTMGDEIRCWGGGVLGNGTRDHSRDPVLLQHGLTGVTGFDLGSFHGCAWTASTVRCWGYNNHGQASASSAGIYQDSPTTIAGITAPAEVSVGFEFSCARDGAVTRCWGRNDVGQLGDSSTTHSATPVAVVGLTNATKLAAGHLHSCAIAGGDVLCWGYGLEGQIGDGQTMIRTVATATGLTNATDIATGKAHSCAIANSQLYCWGDNEVGQLGQGDVVGRTSPTLVTLPAVPVNVVAAQDGTCVRLSDATMYCWGNNESGQMGDGTFDGSLSPLHMTALDGADEIVRSNEGGCVRTGTSVRCWGQTELLGNGDNSTAIPMLVDGCQ
jgi:alpha-tubulin suppressor-like RCC1 family protein